MNQKEPKRSNATHNQLLLSWLIEINFPSDVHNEADFDNPFINGRGFIYLGFSKLSFTF